METLKEILIVLAFVIILVVAIFFGVKVLSGKNVADTSNLENSSIIIGQLDKKNNKRLNMYIEKYGDSTTGTVAYVLSIVQRYSIPICVLMYVVGAFLYYVISIKKFVEGERGYGIIVSSIIFLVIAQVAPLVFALFVTVGRS